MKTTIFIDGCNFLSKIDDVLNPNKDRQIDFSLYNFSALLEQVLSGLKVDRKIFYIGKLLKHPETLQKSEELIEQQRKLKLHLEEQGFEVVIAGRVRGHREKCPQGHETLTFKEKGVDVKISVDMLAMAFNKEVKTAIIGSSDSDLQPAITQLKEYGTELIYLGFETSPNKGLMFTTNRSIIIRNSEVAKFSQNALL